MSYSAKEIADKCAEGREAPATKSGEEYRTYCPAHDDSNPSLYVSDKKRTKNGDPFFNCQTGCDQKAVAKAVYAKMGPKSFSVASKKKKETEAIYQYRTVDGTVEFEKVRFRPKSFLSRKSASEYKLDGCDKTIPYQLPEVTAAILKDEPVFFVEGEKDCESLKTIGCVATCNAFGGSKGKSKWTDENSKWFKNLENAYILPDNDEAGLAHARAIAASLSKLNIRCKIVELPGLSQKGDVSDWLASGGTRDQLIGLIEETPFIEKSILVESKDGNRDVADGGEISKGRDVCVRDQLIECVSDAELWIDDGRVDKSFATIRRNGHSEHHCLRSASFRRLLISRYLDKKGSAPAESALKEAINTLDAMAHSRGKKGEAFLRFGYHCQKDSQKLYLDLCSDDWSIVEIDASGFRTVSSEQCPIRFIRNPSMHSIPIPTLATGSTKGLEDLRDLLQIEEQNWRLIVSCVAHSICGPQFPSPILVVRGEQGGGKSFLLKLLRELIDPSQGDLRDFPEKVDDLYIAAFNNALLVFDNMSTLQQSKSDLLCKICTGGSYATREFYTHTEEVILSVKRPIWLNGLGKFVRRDDLAERSVAVYFSQIPDHARKTESEIRKWFSEHRASLLGDLLNIVSYGLRSKGSVAISNLPRMADFAIFAFAIAPAIGWTGEQFLAVFNLQKKEDQADLIDGSPLGKAVLKMIRAKLKFDGTPTELLDLLPLYADEGDKYFLPKNATSLSSKLSEIAAALRSVGIDFNRGKSNGSRAISLVLQAYASEPEPSQLSINQPEVVELRNW